MYIVLNDIHIVNLMKAERILGKKKKIYDYLKKYGWLWSFICIQQRWNFKKGYGKEIN